MFKKILCSMVLGSVCFVGICEAATLRNKPASNTKAEAMWAAFDDVFNTDGSVATTLTASDGGTVTQATSRATGVTLSTYSGQITTDDTSLAAAAEATFTVTNTVVTALDVIVVSVADTPDADSMILAGVTDVGAGTFDITYSNVSANADTGASVINFIVLRGSDS